METINSHKIYEHKAQNATPQCERLLRIMGILHRFIQIQNQFLHVKQTAIRSQKIVDNPPSVFLISTVWKVGRWTN